MSSTSQARGRSALKARNIRIHSRRTSIKLEPAFWEALESAAARERLAVNDLCSMVSDRAQDYGLTAAIRVFLLCYAWSGKLDAALDAVPVGGLPSPRSG